jgi:hypothetical protein
VRAIGAILIPDREASALKHGLGRPDLGFADPCPLECAGYFNLRLSPKAGGGAVVWLSRMERCDDARQTMEGFSQWRLE